MRKPEISPSRLVRLLWMDARFWTRPLAIGGAALALSVIVLSMFTAFHGGSQGLHAVLYTILMSLGCLVFTSRAFLELRHPLSTQHYLLIPASFEEKFLARYLVSSVGYLVASYLFYLALQLVCEGLNTLVFGRTNALFFFGSVFHLKIMAVYLTFQSLFFAGAVYFRKYSLIKTFATVLGLFIALGIFGYGVFRLFFMGYFDGMQPTEAVALTLAKMAVTGDLFVAYYPIRMWTEWIAQIFFWGLTPLAALAFAYFRLRETEV